jgi:hypothetical protein
VRILRKMAAVLAAAVVSLSVLAAPVSAADTENYAGRLIQLTHGAICHGTGYGSVNGTKVLFAARHCNTGGSEPVWGRNGLVIGYWANNCADGVAPTPSQNCEGAGSNPTAYNNIGQYDMSFIWLTAGYFPSNPHQVYRGVTGVGDWWTNA